MGRWPTSVKPIRYSRISQLIAVSHGVMGAGIASERFTSFQKRFLGSPKYQPDLANLREGLSPMQTAPRLSFCRDR